jgi:Cu(I)/Ag(I) efflux system membrane fusion protein
MSKFLAPFKSKFFLICLAIVFIGGASFVFSKRSNAPSPSPTTSTKKVIYSCPMHPAITSDHPDQCPICHMDLQKVDDDSGAEDRGQGSLKNEDTQADASSVSGRAGFSLSTEKQQLIGVTTAKVGFRVLSSEIRATGRVAFDPELYTAVEEYRQALIARSQMSEKPYGALREQSDALINSSKMKLKIMGLTDSQIQSLSAKGASSISLILPEGKVWVYAEIFEYEVQGVKRGQKVEAVAPSIPGKVFLGKISSISPILNAPTRTVRVRAEVPDPEGLLRPETFLNVKIKIERGEKLAIPEDSVLHSGDRSFVFVVKEKGRFEPRPVSLGQKTGDFFEVIDGLKEGEEVVTAANFLIDSESRLRAVLQQMSPTNPPAEKHHDRKNH